jgi:polyferredoxin
VSALGYCLVAAIVAMLAYSWIDREAWMAPSPAAMTVAVAAGLLWPLLLLALVVVWLRERARVLG